MTASTAPAAATNEGDGGITGPTPEEVEAIITRARAAGILDEPAPAENIVNDVHDVPAAVASGYDFEPGEGAELLDELHRLLVRYVVTPSKAAADAVVLWIAASHGQPAFEHAPRLAAISPEKRCGKSRLMDIVAETAHRPLITVNATIAAVVRAVGDDPPSILVDEADSIFGNKKSAEANEDLRGLLNAGHQRNRPMLRCVGPLSIPTEFPTFAFAMLAGIGNLPDTIMDRAVVVRMRRRAPGETVAPFRSRRDAPALNALRDALAAWVRAHLAELRQAIPDMPLEDRAADTWEPMVAVADLAGGRWPQAARAAALELVGEEEGTDADSSLGIRLLSDLRDVFGARPLSAEERATGVKDADRWQEVDKLSTETILSRLTLLDDAPWGDLFGKPLDARGLARKLLPYRVKPKKIRVGDSTPKGYERSQLHDAWARYLPQVGNEGEQGNTAGQDVPGVPLFPSQGEHDSEGNALTSTVTHVPDVPHTPPEDGDGVLSDDYGMDKCVRCAQWKYGTNDGGGHMCGTCRAALPPTTDTTEATT